MALIQTYEIASRKHQSVVAIPWAEEVVFALAPPTAYKRVENLGRKALKRLLLEPKLDTYPASAVDHARFVGAQLIKAKRRSSRPKDIQELGITVKTVILIRADDLTPSWGLQKPNKTSFTRKLQTLELNSYPATTTPDQPLTSFLAKPYSIRQEKRKLLKTQELNSFPATPAIAPEPLTSYLARPYVIRQEKRKPLNLQELNFYPQVVTTSASLPALFKRDTILRKATKRHKLTLTPLPSLVKFTKGIGFGIGSVLSNNGIGETGVITNDGIGKVGEL